MEWFWDHKTACYCWSPKTLIHQWISICVRFRVWTFGWSPNRTFDGRSARHRLSKATVAHNSCESFGRASLHSYLLSLHSSWYWETFIQSSCQIEQFSRSKIDKKVINSSTNCLISVKIAIPTHHIIPSWMFGWYSIYRNIKDFISLKNGSLLHAQNKQFEHAVASFVYMHQFHTYHHVCLHTTSTTSHISLEYEDELNIRWESKYSLK